MCVGVKNPSMKSSYQIPNYLIQRPESPNFFSVIHVHVSSCMRLCNLERLHWQEWKQNLGTLLWRFIILPTWGVVFLLRVQICILGTDVGMNYQSALITLNSRNHFLTPTLVPSTNNFWNLFVTRYIDTNQQPP